LKEQINPLLISFVLKEMSRELVLLVFSLVFTCGATLQDLCDIIPYIEEWGYSVEVHTTTTEDGYELILHRILNNESPDDKSAVLLVHGLTDASAGYCLNGPGKSLPFILVDDGYDVWIGNNRGNGYSMNNIYFGPNTTPFWQFSWDEMAEIDFPQMINYVCQTTQNEQISYVGHSQGTIQAFAGLISNSSIAEQLNIFIALAPVAYVGGITVEVWKVLTNLYAFNLLSAVGVKEFSIPAAAHTVLSATCLVASLTNPLELSNICLYGSEVLYGQNSYFNTSRAYLYLLFEPFPTSVQNMMHWTQGIKNGLFQKYDYGTMGNMEKYEQSTPPAYSFENYPTDLLTVLVTGGMDGLADPADVQKLKVDLRSRNANFIEIYNPDYGHLDPLLGYQAYDLTYPQILSFIDDYAT